MSILSLLDGEEPENDTIPQIPFLIFGEKRRGEVLRLSKQDTAQKQVWVRPGIEGTRPPLTFGIMSDITFVLQNQAQWSSPEPCPRERQREPPPPLVSLA